jgi:hypothetical protein
MVMAVVDMRCPKCGKQSTEYQKNKWRCLACGAYFLYEPPIEPVKPDIYVKKENINILDEESNFFTCQVCYGKFPRTKCTRYTCRKCQAIVCESHAIQDKPNLPPICTKCAGHLQLNVKWYHKTSFVVISVLCLGPLALPLVLYNPQYSVTSKVIWTIIIIAGTLLLCIGSMEMYAQFLKSIEQMGL